MEYEAVEVNNREMSWVRVKIPNLNDPLRWVAGECGTKSFTIPTLQEEKSTARKGKECRTKNTYDSNVLAMSWQPAFCKYVAKPGTKPECEALHEGELVIDHLTLHGLWPNKKSCGTNYGNCGGEKLNLEESTVSHLAPFMPNFYYETDLGTHEWDKHGTCQSLSDDDYFLNALRLVKAVDKSTIGTFIKSRVGTSMTEKEFFDEVAQQNGDDLADKITLVCTKNTYLQEVRLSLPASIPAGDDLKAITAGAPKAAKKTMNCTGPIVIESSGFGVCPPVGPGNSAAATGVRAY